MLRSSRVTVGKHPVIDFIPQRNRLYYLDDGVMIHPEYVIHIIKGLQLEKPLP